MNRGKATSISKADWLAQDIPKYITDHGWEGWANMHRTAHDCPGKPRYGSWRVTWVGDYANSYGCTVHAIAYRCTGCGCVSQVTQEDCPDYSMKSNVILRQWCP